MKKLSIIGFLLLLLFQTACREEFGKTLFGPDKTVAPEILTDRELVFVNTTETSDISSAREMTLDPVDVIFSSVQPIGYTKEVTVSAKLRDGQIASDNVFYLNVLKDEAVLDAFKTHVGYKAEFLPEAAYKLENDMVVFEKMERLQSIVVPSVLLIVSHWKLIKIMCWLYNSKLQPGSIFLKRTKWFICT